MDAVDSPGRSMVEASLPFASRRSPVSATRGVAARSQSLASQTGLEVLMRGGNAADAAVATAAALNVTEPCSTGLGGDCFALYYEEASGTITALNGSGRAPAGLSLDLLREEGLSNALPPYHAHTVTVPGACERGGVLSGEDLPAHRSPWDAPIHTTYKDVRVHECPPNGQGLVALLALNILSEFDLPREALGVDRLHLLVEAFRPAFAVGGAHLADPAPGPVAVGGA